MVQIYTNQVKSNIFLSHRIKILQDKRISSGFTIVELLLVIGILTILLAIVLVAINPAQQFKLANDTRRTNDINSILNAVHQYAATNKGSYPASIGSSTLGIASSGGINLCSFLVPNYLAGIPTDPLTGNYNGSVGAPVTTCTGATYVTNYTIRMINSRISVSATSEVAPSIPITITL